MSKVWSCSGRTVPRSRRRLSKASVRVVREAGVLSLLVASAIASAAFPLQGGQEPGSGPVVSQRADAPRHRRFVVGPWPSGSTFGEDGGFGGGSRGAGIVTAPGFSAAAPPSFRPLQKEAALALLTTRNLERCVRGIGRLAAAMRPGAPTSDPALVGAIFQYIVEACGETPAARATERLRQQDRVLG